MARGYNNPPGIDLVAHIEELPAVSLRYLIGIILSLVPIRKGSDHISRASGIGQTQLTYVLFCQKYFPFFCILTRRGVIKDLAFKFLLKGVV
jgi:hypothetical protein